jgi:hypothetical protein
VDDTVTDSNNNLATAVPVAVQAVQQSELAPEGGAETERAANVAEDIDSKTSNINTDSDSATSTTKTASPPGIISTVATQSEHDPESGGEIEQQAGSTTTNINSIKASEDSNGDDACPTTSKLRS